MSKPMTRPHEEVEPQAIEAIDGAPYMALIEERFGISPGVFDAYLWHRPNRKLVSLVCRDHEAPRRPEALSIGLPFLRTNLTYPKMTTGATLCFGSFATRHVITLRPEQLDPYYRREPLIELFAEQLDRCESSGYVILRFEGVTLGQGVFFVASEDRPHRMQSLYPKAFANGAHRAVLGSRV